MLQLTLIVLHVLAMQVIGADYKRICYFTNWSQYRVGDANYRVANVDPTLCTHIIFAFAGMEGNQIKTTEYNDPQMYRDIIGLKSRNPELKVLLSVGGGNANLTIMSEMLATRTTRGLFIDSCTSLLLQYGFDGLDLDFEYPAKPPSVPEDKERFALLLQEMKEAFLANATTQSFLLTVVVPTYKIDVDRGYDVQKLIMYADCILLVTYDYHGPWSTETGHNSPLYEPNPDGPFGSLFNMNYGAIYWLRLGVPKEKMIISIAFYGRGFLLADPEDTGFNANVTQGSPKQEYTKEVGYLAYYEVCWHLQRPGRTPTVVRSQEQQVPYFYRDTLWVGYHDAESLRNKVRWLKTFGFGGFWVWDLSLDDFKGAFCAEGPYPLLKALNEEILADPGDPPLPPPRYLLDPVCGPCVSRNSGFDCNPNDTSIYHQCADGIVVHTGRCPAISPAFSAVTENCVTEAQQRTEEPCENTLNCGRAPEAEAMEAVGMFGTLEPITIPSTTATTTLETKATSTVPSVGGSAGDPETVQRASNTGVKTLCHWKVMIVFLILLLLN